MSVVSVFDEDKKELGPVGSAFIAMDCSFVIPSVDSRRSAPVAGN